jgi:hypothetical protein
MTEKRSTATADIIRHVARAREALRHLGGEHNTTSDGVLRSPRAQGAALKIAAEEIRKAVAVFERTKWK